MLFVSARQLFAFDQRLDDLLAGHFGLKIVNLARAGAFVAAVGSSKPAARELDDALLARADLIVVEWLPAAQSEAGEFVRAAPGTIDPARVTELGKLLVRGSAFERRPRDVIVYKSVGVGLEDVAMAKLAYDRLQ